MDIKALKKIVAEAYAIKDSDEVMPRFSTQFTFTQKEILVRIPIHEGQSPKRELLGLICGVINTALPDRKIKQEDLQQDLLAAAFGAKLGNEQLDIRAVFMSTAYSGRRTDDAVTECQILIRAA